jgi:hypothetical protein
MRREDSVANSMIAIQIANGAFVPVLDTASRKRRRLVVTTVRDNQTSVKVELYRGADAAMANPEYVGSLLIANIEPAAGGSPDVAVLLGIDDAGNLNATATDTRSGEYQSLSVNLEQLESDGGYDVPDFQLSDDELSIGEVPLDDDELTFEDVSPEGDELESFSQDDLSDDAPFGTAVALGSVDEQELPDSSNGRASVLDDLADEEFAFDDSFANEPVEDTPETDVITAGDEPDELETSFEPDLVDDLVEADLGDEDFTFDESDSDEIHDTLSREEFDQMDAEPAAVGGPTSRSDYDEEIRPRRSNALVFVGYMILALAALGVLAYLVFRLLEGPPAPRLRVGPIGELSVALLFLGIPARRITHALQHRKASRNKR